MCIPAQHVECLIMMILETFGFIRINFDTVRHVWGQVQVKYAEHIDFIKTFGNKKF